MFEKDIKDTKETKEEKLIEFDKLKRIWAELAITEAAKNEIKDITYYLDELELRASLRDTTNSKAFIEAYGNPPLQNVSEIKEIMDVAVRGDCLSPYQLERVEKVLVIVDRLRSYLTRGRSIQNPLAYYDENLDEAGELRDEILAKIRGDMVDDHATKRLFEIRSQIMTCEDKMKQKAELIIRSHKECMADSFYTLRNGRICLPVKKEYKFKISGSVIDKSSTGNTFFIEPSGLAGLYEELALLRIEEENEVYQILYVLSAMVAEKAEAMEENIRVIERLDFIFSKGKLSIELGCVEPEINLDRVIELEDARHPLMDRNINVPLQFELGREKRGIIITGPNTGGKTVAIKTVMLNCVMAQCGLHVTCKKANICMNTRYLCDIGDGQDISENLSTFSAHIKNVLHILRIVDRESFVIMDELGSGTDPAEGMGIAIAILEELRKSEANFLVTTHYPEVKEYATRSEGIINARMTFDKKTLRPTYQMIIGEAGESCAFYIADRLGMPASMLKVAAEAAYGKNISKDYSFNNDEIQRTENRKLSKYKPSHVDTKLKVAFSIGDSVMIYPDKKIGIVCETVNDKGVLRVQVADRKIWINHKRVKLYIKAEELYPEDYDFSIIFDSAEDRKKRHDMSRKYTEDIIESDGE